jgi:SagB-type dehydrogenase family enzyme
MNFRPSAPRQRLPLVAGRMIESRARRCLGLLCGIQLAAAGSAPVQAAEESVAEVVRLPAPQVQGGKPLMEALRDRRSVREFSAAPLSWEQLSNLLWAAYGINRPESGQRTAPTTMNLQCLDLYVALAKGVYRYEAKDHALIVVDRADVRALTGSQDYVKQAAVALVLVADHAKMTKISPAERDFYATADAGYVSQNVYLFCASVALGSVVHIVGDKLKLGDALKLRPEQRIVLAHSVGQPAAH